MRGKTRVLFGLLLFNCISAVGGGTALMIGAIPQQASWLRHTDFAGQYFPGVILMAVVGGSSLVAALAMKKHAAGWQLSSIVAGVVMLVWIVGEIASIRGFHFLQVVYLATGALVVWCTPGGELMVSTAGGEPERKPMVESMKLGPTSSTDSALGKLG